MRKFFIITNHAKDPGLEVTNSVAGYLGSHGADVVLREPHGQGKARHTDPGEVPEGTECVLVLGGDGTLLRAAVDLVELNIPMLGVNLGALGYLAEIDRGLIYPALEMLLEDRCRRESRMMLRGDVWHEEKRIFSHVVLNDIFVTREGSPRIISLKTYVNDSYLNEYHADGLIVSTPSGSTGYSLSAGGPIIAPEAELFLMTPLAEHSLNARSVVLPSDSRICVEVGEGKDTAIEHAMATFDGDRTIPLVTGDRVEIRMAEQNVTFMKIQDNSFLETLRKKMNR